MRENKHSKYEIWQPLILALVAILGMLAGQRMGSQTTVPMIQKVESESELGVGRVEEVIRFIENKYVEDIETDSILESAINAVISTLDPHSVYIPPERLEEVNDQMRGSFDGLGMETLWIRDTLVITATEIDGPANLAGLQRSDRILQIDTQTIANKEYSNNEIRDLLRKKKGEQISLVVKSPGIKEYQDFKVRIDEIPLPSADIGFMVDEETGYILINRFSSDTYKSFMKTLETLVDDDEIKNLIIDVRDNPGGFLPETTKILSQLFAEKDKLLVYTKGKDERVSEFKSTGRNFFDVGQIAILINEYSASGSEILAGAIQDWDRGVIIGRRSFGKGLVQEQYPLSNGGALRLTVSKYYTPSGRCIQRTYEDRKDYTNEIVDRIQNGEMYSGDIPSIEDTTLYFTKILKRKMYGGGGIFPDTFVGADSVHHSSCYKSLSTKLPIIAFNYYEKNQEDIPNSESEFLNEFEITDDMIPDLISDYLDTCDLDWFTNSDILSIISNDITALVAKYAFGKNMEVKTKSRQDASVLKAIELFSKTVIASLENGEN